MAPDWHRLRHPGDCDGAILLHHHQPDDPLAGGGVFTTRQLYPFTLGANIGTTITALLAATAISGAGASWR